MPPRAGVLRWNRPDSSSPTAPDGPQKPAGPRRPLPKTVNITVNNVVQGDIDQLRQEIIRNLKEDGGEITVEVTVSARKPGGFSQSTVRSVRENSYQLGFDFDNMEA